MHRSQAYVLLQSPQAATAIKQRIESFGEGQQYTKKFTVNYTNPYNNPFKTLPKDGPMRNASGSRSGSGGYNSTSGVGIQQTNSNTSIYRGNRGGGYNNRSGPSGYGRGGFGQHPSPGFHGVSMGGFQGTPIGGLQQYGSFSNRGGVMGSIRAGPMAMRGARGGMGSNAMMGMPMGNMGIGPSMGTMGMGMPQMGMQGTHKFRFQLLCFRISIWTYRDKRGFKQGSRSVPDTVPQAPSQMLKSPTKLRLCRS